MKIKKEVLIMALEEVLIVVAGLIGLVQFQSENFTKRNNIYANTFLPIFRKSQSIEPGSWLYGYVRILWSSFKRRIIKNLENSIECGH